MNGVLRGQLESLEAGSRQAAAALVSEAAARNAAEAALSTEAAAR